MTHEYPDYLRLHTEDRVQPAPELTEIRGWETICSAFASCTGWELTCGDAEVDPPADATPVAQLPATQCGGCSLWVQPAETATSRHSDALSQERVRPLAEAIGGIIEQLLAAQTTVWQQEADLAAGIPVTLRPEGQKSLAEQFESILRGGAEAIGCQATALYLLDDATSHLKLRAAWNLPKNRFLEPARPLRGSAADLEALVGHAVALEDTALLPHWKTPEDFPAALCVPVATQSTPLGTLWLFCDHVREFTAEQIHVVEIVAGRLVSDLEREVLAREGWQNRQADMSRQTLAEWQREQIPRMAPLVDGWQIAGSCGSEDEVTGRFHDWCILPDGRLAVAVGSSEGPAVDAGLTATTLQVALRAHAAHPHEPRHMLDQLNESIWTHSTGNRFAALFYAIIDPDSGELHYASAGEIHALIQHADDLDPLTEDFPLLGFDPDHRYRQSKHGIARGQSLVIFTPAPVTALDEEVFEPDECRVAMLLQKHHEAPAEEQVAAIAKELESPDGPPRSVVCVRRIF